MRGSRVSKIHSGVFGEKLRILRRGATATGLGTRPAVGRLRGLRRDRPGKCRVQDVDNDMQVRVGEQQGDAADAVLELRR